MAPKSKATKASGSGLGKISAKRKSPALSITTRLECIEGSSSKFWEISVNTNTTIVVFGKIGDAGRSTTKVHKDKAAALKFKEKQVATKVKGGYTVADGGRPSTKKPKTKKHTKAELESPTVESIPLDVPFVQRYLRTYVFPEPVVGVFNYTSNDVNEWNWDRRPSPCRECGDDECECGDGCGYDTEGPLMWSVNYNGQSFILLFFGAAYCGDSIGSYNTIFDSKSKEIMRIDVGNGQDCTIKDDAEWSSNAMKKKYLGFMTQMKELLTTYPF